MKEAGVVSVVLVVLALAVVFFLLAGWVVMMLGNVVLNHYDATTLDYTASLAVTALSIVLFSSGSFAKRS